MINFYGLHHSRGRDRILRSWDPWGHDEESNSMKKSLQNKKSNKNKGNKKLKKNSHLLKDVEKGTPQHQQQEEEDNDYDEEEDNELHQSSVVGVTRSQMSYCAYATYGWILRWSKFPHLRCCRFCGSSQGQDYPELTALRNYFGQKTVSYFAWFMYHTHAMAALAIFGVFVELFIRLGEYVADAELAANSTYGLNVSMFNEPSSSTMSTTSTMNNNFIDGALIMVGGSTWVRVAIDYALIIWAVMVCVWATLVGEGWKRFLAQLYCLWGVEESDAECYVRPEFIGDVRIPSDPTQFADGRTTTKGNTRQRYCMYLIQVPVFITCFTIVVFAWWMVDYLKVNVFPDLQGVVDIYCFDNITGTFDINTTSIPSCCGPTTVQCTLAKDAQNDLFSDDNLLINGVVAGHSALITLTNFFWGYAALSFTKWENHR